MKETLQGVKPIQTHYTSWLGLSPVLMRSAVPVEMFRCFYMAFPNDSGLGRFINLGAVERK